MIRAIAFDFDGVLAESVNIKTEAYVSLFQQEEEEAVRRIVEYHLKNMGVSRFEKFNIFYRDILKRPLNKEKFGTLCDQFSKLVVEKVIAAPWVEGAREFLLENKANYSFFVVSGTPQEELKEIIRRRGMESLFDEIMGSPKTKDVLHGELMRIYGFHHAEIVYIGDAETDWNAARKTGIPFIWRRVSEKPPFLSGFTGPSIFSLDQLKHSLSEVNASLAES